ncbi:unnamed protein product [Commensalibacter communis]|uniref:Uncharacterized protein n=1 Tax=Commensalibacter communis TaxID=2972786 RepID=A0A9W4TPA5_9PROT|nr:unnamed protein product [Commensalibacter communis]CAI3924719.1 unnamed protein product [Commensalibacter communis]CAI3945917.1 unnamed protein product [Commensalibacter communis]CAI3946436.1 unnamed protein product [Commensalibacter communis]
MRVVCTIFRDRYSSRKYLTNLLTILFIVLIGPYQLPQFHQMVQDITKLVSLKKLHKLLFTTLIALYQQSLKLMMMNRFGL